MRNLAWPQPALKRTAVQSFLPAGMHITFHDRMTGSSGKQSVAVLAFLIHLVLWYTLSVQKDQDNLEEICCHAPGSWYGQ